MQLTPEYLSAEEEVKLLPKGGIPPLRVVFAALCQFLPRRVVSRFSLREPEVPTDFNTAVMLTAEDEAVTK